MKMYCSPFRQNFHGFYHHSSQDQALDDGLRVISFACQLSCQFLSIRLAIFHQEQWVKCHYPF